MDVDALAAEVFAECRRTGQAARRVASDEDAEGVRAQVRRLARGAGVRVRTARLDDAVVAVRRDAQLWDQDAATMRAELTPR